MTECAHVSALPSPDVAPQSDTCPGCLAAGTNPVHLRLCLTCGHVGCCDSSPLRHATAHFHETGHPVMRSFEPGENWRWCHADKSLV
ncbi:UBP-type zinc finger domain-containing protein [Streptomyces sp. NPDC051940]|uniref:UBP-type zinc finger domain-containing protein n=1 Tax=Streptomyces sp. NPDC051940 TaxID=3155675 RepID=UPI003437C842